MTSIDEQEVKPDRALLKRQVARAKRLDDIHINCRIGGRRHWWEQKAPDWVAVGKVIPLAYQCVHCLTIKRMEISQLYGEIIRPPEYEYPDGYQLRHGEGDDPGEPLISPPAVRLAIANRTKSLPGIEPLQ